jgi:hypothetical protein
MTPYAADGRLPFTQLIATYRKLAKQSGWLLDTIGQQRVSDEADSDVDLPIVCLRTRSTGPAFYCLAGIHGEEPAGPNALSLHIEQIAAFGLAFPIVLFPLCNPLGYVRNWRYPNEARDTQKGTSVGDSSHLLPESSNLSQPRSRTASCPEAAALTHAIVTLAQSYPPLVVIDHHEDEALAASYVYSQGTLGADDPVAHHVVKLLRESGISLQMRGNTRFGEPINEGVISDVQDGSVDELLAARSIIRDGRVAPGPSARSVIVVETPTVSVPLAKRIKAHAAVIGAYDELWRIAHAGNNGPGTPDHTLA